MSNNLLVNLSQYAPRETILSTENFITETFAWLLRNDPDVFQALIQLLQDKFQEYNSERKDEVIESFNLTREFYISTQENFNGKFPDMVIESHQSMLVFEHKVWSNLHHNQLHNYRYHMEQERKIFNYRLILITARSTQHMQNPDVALCWQEIATCIDELTSENEKISWIRQEFINLLAANNLLYISSIDPLSVVYYHDAKKIDNQLFQIAQNLYNLQNQPLMEQSHFQKVDQVRNIWERIGYELFLSKESFTVQNTWDQQWFPGVFMGFVMNSYDHMLEDIMPNNSPIVSFILSIDKTCHPIQQFPAYRPFVAELTEKLKNSRIWKISDRTLRCKHNPWHPLIIYCTIYDFYTDASNFGFELDSHLDISQLKMTNLQHKIFQSEMAKLQQAFIECPSFKLLCNEIQNK